MTYDTKQIKVTSSMCCITREGTSHRSPSVEGKGKVHPCRGTEALYRPYGP